MNKWKTAKTRQKECLRHNYLNWWLRPQTPNILLTGNPGTTNIHIEDLQINLNMGESTNLNGVPIEERISLGTSQKVFPDISGGMHRLLPFADMFQHLGGEIVVQAPVR